MIKVRVTQLQAPWPEGVFIGAIVALMCASLPAWALGKCEDAPEGADPQFAWEPPPVQDAATAKPASADDKLAALAASLNEAMASFAEAQAKTNAAIAALAAKLDEKSAGDDANAASTKAPKK